MVVDTVIDLVTRYQSGDEEAARLLFDRYVRRLLAFARRRLSPKLAPRLDPEDIIQSAYQSFFVRARKNEYTIHKDRDLWCLLAAITIHKIHEAVARHHATKRSIDLEQASMDAAFDCGPSRQVDRDPSVEEMLGVAEEIELLMRGLPVEKRHMLQYRLQGYTFEEIAEMSQRSERTVRRFFDELRARLRERLRAHSQITERVRELN